ncbi:MAG: esterase-like activity of phytase family protein [Planctomycetaceae bacterium]
MGRTAVAALLAGGAIAAGATGVAAREPRVIATWTVPRAPLSAGVVVGGLSDLAASPIGGALHVWTVTDRGPNGTVKIDGEKVRTLLAPDFAPSLVRVRLPDGGGAAVVEQVVPLRGADGRPLSGRPPGTDRLVDAKGRRPVADDPGGVDPEGLVAVGDGTFWIAEEYRPGLLHVDAAGRVLARFVPRGMAGVAGDRDSLPEIYARRRENRGFEALAASPGGSRLWALLQSPLDVPGRAAGRRTGNVRLLAFDPVAGAPVAEHVYRLGDPGDPAYLTHGSPPDDGKLCAMAALDGDTLLVLEQDDHGLARLYAADLAAATDTLGLDPGDGRTLEQVADLPAAGVVPVRKTLVADMTALRQRMRAQVDEDTKEGGALKIEGLAVIDRQHVAVVNDNDFGVAQGEDGPGRGTRVWLLELPVDLETLVAAAP